MFEVCIQLEADRNHRDLKANCCTTELLQVYFQLEAGTNEEIKWIKEFIYLYIHIFLYKNV